jgi:hypothetical protein
MTRAFIVGNGPSLKPEQLDKLIPEVSFGVNRIHLMYDKTKWHPDYYVYMDLSMTTHEIFIPDLEYHSQQEYTCYIRSDIINRLIKRSTSACFQNITAVEECSHIDAERNTTQEWHLPRICNMGGSVSGAIQLAVMEGFNPIYLIGCDGGLGGNANNHFSPDYVNRDCMTVQMAMLGNKTLDLAHNIAGRECKERGVSIFNATVGGSAISGINLCDFYELFD